MLSILYFATMTNGAWPDPRSNGVRVCFDLEAFDEDILAFVGNPDWDEEHNEETTCNICTRVAYNGQWITDKKCNKGIDNRHENFDLDATSCIEFTKTWFRIDDKEFYVQTDCGDGMWLDRFSVLNNEAGWDGPWKYYGPKRKDWGMNNDFGWCFSTDMSDHNSFKAKTNGKCYGTLRFKPDGTTWGWYGNNQNQPNLGRRLSIERRLAGIPGNVPDLDSEEPLVFTEGEEAVPMEHELATAPSSPEDLVGFTEGGELAVPMEHEPAAASPQSKEEQDFTVEERADDMDGRF